MRNVTELRENKIRKPSFMLALLPTIEFIYCMNNFCSTHRDGEWFIRKPKSLYSPSGVDFDAKHSLA